MIDFPFTHLKGRKNDAIKYTSGIFQMKVQSALIWIDLPITPCRMRPRPLWYSETNGFIIATCID